MLVTRMHGNRCRMPLEKSGTGKTPRRTVARPFQGRFYARKLQSSVAFAPRRRLGTPAKPGNREDFGGFGGRGPVLRPRPTILQSVVANTRWLPRREFEESTLAEVLAAFPPSPAAMDPPRGREPKSLPRGNFFCPPPLSDRKGEEHAENQPPRAVLQSRAWRTMKENAAAPKRGALPERGSHGLLPLPPTATSAACTPHALP